MMMTTATNKKIFSPEEQLLRAWDVAKLLGVSIPTVWRWTREGKLPQPMKITQRITVWRKTEIIPCVEALLAG